MTLVDKKMKEKSLKLSTQALFHQKLQHTSFTNVSSRKCENEKVQQKLALQDNRKEFANQFIEKLTNLMEVLTTVLIFSLNLRVFCRSQNVKDSSARIV